ncbi:hypothetical protein E2320_015195 [Naja naja]|nr:hypothetical protein E2320_015195 [Naja naja]
MGIGMVGEKEQDLLRLLCWVERTSWHTSPILLIAASSVVCRGTDFLGINLYEKKFQVVVGIASNAIVYAEVNPKQRNRAAEIALPHLYLVKAPVDFSLA